MIIIIFADNKLHEIIETKMPIQILMAYTLLFEDSFSLTQVVSQVDMIEFFNEILFNEIHVRFYFSLSMYFHHFVGSDQGWHSSVCGV